MPVERLRQKEMNTAAVSAQLVKLLLLKVDYPSAP
jgi:hypothetical protein